MGGIGCHPDPARTRAESTGWKTRRGGPAIGFLRHIAADSLTLRPVDLHNCEGFTVFSGDQRRVGRVSHLIYGSDVDTPEAVAVVRHGLTGSQTEVVPIGRVDLINTTTQIVQLREAADIAADAEAEVEV